MVGASSPQEDSQTPLRRVTEMLASACLLVWFAAISYHFYTKLGILDLVAQLLGMGER